MVNSLEDEIDCSFNGDIREQALYVEGGGEVVLSSSLPRRISRKSAADERLYGFGTYNVNISFNFLAML